MLALLWLRALILRAGIGGWSRGEHDSPHTPRQKGSYGHVAHTQYVPSWETSLPAETAVERADPRGTERRLQDQGHQRGRWNLFAYQAWRALHCAAAAPLPLCTPPAPPRPLSPPGNVFLLERLPLSAAAVAKSKTNLHKPWTTENFLFIFGGIPSE